MKKIIVILFLFSLSLIAEEPTLETFGTIDGPDINATELTQYDTIHRDSNISDNNETIQLENLTEDPSLPQSDAYPEPTSPDETPNAKLPENRWSI
jgi:hypothetical protein